MDWALSKFEEAWDAYWNPLTEQQIVRAARRKLRRRLEKAEARADGGGKRDM